MVIWTARRAWRYGRILIAPLPAWTVAEKWQYAPLPRVPLSALELALHLAPLGFGVWSLSRWVRAVIPLECRGHSSHAKLLPIAVPLLALIALTGLGWWVTTPRVVATVPQDGANGVPRDVTVSIQMQKRAWLWRQLNAGGFGISAHYADTGVYISSMSGGRRRACVSIPRPRSGPAHRWRSPSTAPASGPTRCTSLLRSLLILK